MATVTHTTLSKFKAALSSGGARPSLFDVSVAIPSGFGTATEISSTCSVSSIPPLTVTPIERQYFGRTVKIPGDMVFGDLSTTIINTEDFSVVRFLQGAKLLGQIRLHEGETLAEHGELAGVRIPTNCTSGTCGT